MMMRTLASLVLALVLGVSALAPAAEEKEPSGTIEIEQTQVAVLLSGSFGGGVLHFGSRSYEFEIGGLGVGGFGVSTIEAKGKVYDLNDIADFPGVYGQVRAGYAYEKESAGGLWLENPKGVKLHLDAEREGMMLSVGADGVVIRLKQ